MKFTNKYNLPEEITKALIHDWYKGSPDSISVTRLIDSPRIFYLMLRHDDEIEIDVSERVWTLLGSAIHYALEKIELKNHLKEERLSYTIDGIKITGKFDVFGGDEKITDYKVTSVYSIIYKDRLNEWTKQLNVYAWLLRKYGFNPKSAQIIAILRDWTTNKAKQNNDFPQIPICVIPIRLWTSEEAENFVKNRVALFKSVKDLPDDELPSCTSEERWETKTTYAVKMRGRKRAVAVYDTEEEAIKKATEIGGTIEERKGEAKRCEQYCPVNKFCKYYKGGKR